MARSNCIRCSVELITGKNRHIKQRRGKKCETGVCIKCEADRNAAYKRKLKAKNYVEPVPVVAEFKPIDRLNHLAAKWARVKLTG